MPQLNEAPHAIDVNHIDDRVFPSETRRGRSCEQLKIQGIRARDLIAKYGTPLYVVDEVEARRRARTITEAFQHEFARVGTEATVYYAGKAFLCIEVAQWMTEEGLNVDVSSEGELAVALAAGVDPARIGLHGNNKSEAEIARAVEVGLGAIVIDSEQEIARVAAAASKSGKRQKVRLRVNSGVHASTHDFLATSHEDQKFGLPLGRAVELAHQIREYESLEFLGLHCHIGSQIFATEGFRESARRLLGAYRELAAEGPVPELNLGGGFGIAYTPAEADEAPDVARLAGELADIVRDTCAQYEIPMPKVAFEPGRSIMGPAGVTLYSVGTTKPVALTGSGDRDPLDEGHDSRLYVSVDGGMSDNVRPAMYGAQYHAVIANRRSDATPTLARVVGKHCESGDIVVDRVLLPSDITPGDTLAVPATGAYCWSMSSNYNYLPRPAVVAVNNEDSRVIVRGQTIDELVAQSVNPSQNGAA